MNNGYYEEIYKQFEAYYPYLVDDIEDWRPRGDSGIRLTMRNGTKYDFYLTSRSIRMVEDRPIYDFNDLSEKQWRSVFADRLQEKMIVKGYSQQTLADYTGLSKGAINKYVNGDATPSGYALAKLARILDCAIAELVD